MQILRHELYKIFSRKSIYLAFVVLLGLYGMFIQGDIKRALYSMIPEEYYAEFEGPLTQQKIDRGAELKKAVEFNKMDEDHGKYYVKTVGPDGSESYSLTEEGRILRILAGKVENAVYKKESFDDKLSQLVTSIKSYEGNGEDGYKYRSDKLQYNMLKKLEGPGIYFSEAWKKIIDFVNTFGLVLVGAMILLGLSPVFSEEYTNNMDSLIMSTRNGKSKVVTAKILSSIIYIVLVCAVFAAVNLTVNIGAFGIRGWNDPIQSLSKYTGSPYFLSVYQYHIMQLVFQIGGGTALGLLTLAVSTVSRHSLIPFFIGGGIFAFPELGKRFIGDEDVLLKTIMDFSCTTFMKVEGLFMSFKDFNVLGFPVLYPYLSAAVMLLLSIASVIFIYNAFKRHQVVG